MTLSSATRVNETKDVLVRGSACDQTVRCVAAVTTRLVDEAARRHCASPTASAALGRTLTAGLLLASLLKDDERVTIQLQCNGPIGGITVEADTSGAVRGFAKNPLIDLPPTEKKKLDVSGLVGSGMLYVLRDGDYYRTGLYQEPYCGSVPIVSGEIAEDIAYYLTKSEQIPSAVSLGVFAAPDGERAYRVEASGGFLIQTFPGTDEGVIDHLAKSIIAAPHVTQMIREGLGPEEILKTALGDYNLQVSEQKTLRFACSCSEQRARRILAAIDPAELKRMLLEDGGVEMVCQFCSATYRFNADRLQVDDTQDGP